MTFLDPWTSAYEGVPPDTENINLGANRIRDLKVNIRERINIDHSFGDALDNGRHNEVSFNVTTTDPSLPAGGDVSFLYAKPISGNMELFYEDNGGNKIQLTVAGAVNFSTFPSGTRMPFIQASPPTGWAVFGGVNDQVLRVVNDGSGGTGGGSWTISGTNVATGTGSLAASSGSSGSVSGTVAGHTLVVGEVPSHTHNVTVGLSGAASANTAAGSSLAVFGSQSYTTDGGTGGNGSHSHGWSGSISVTTNTTISGAPTASFSNDGTWRPNYVNACVGQKS